MQEMELQRAALSSLSWSAVLEDLSEPRLFRGTTRIMVTSTGEGRVQEAPGLGTRLRLCIFKHRSGQGNSSFRHTSM